MDDALHLFIRDGQGQYLIPLTLRFVQEEGLWCGHCIELGTATFSESLDQVRQELRAAVKMQLEEVARFNELDYYLVWLGVVRYPIPEPIHEKTGSTVAELVPV